MASDTAGESLQQISNFVLIWSGIETGWEKKELLSNSRPGAGERSVVLIDTNIKKQCNKKRRLKM